MQLLRCSEALHMHRTTSMEVHIQKCNTACHSARHGLCEPGINVMLVCDSRTMSSRVSLQALLPLFISPLTGRGTTNAVSLGAMGDSYYEYLLKARRAAACGLARCLAAHLGPPLPLHLHSTPQTCKPCMRQG